MEIAEVENLFHDARHPYTLGLLQAMPRLDENGGRLYNIQGNVPNFKNMPQGCPFSSRCEHSTPHCVQETPPMTELSPGHCVSCWRVGEKGNRKVDM